MANSIVLSTTFVVPANLNSENVAVRMAGTQDEPLFCLSDVCELLGINDDKQVFERLDEDERGWYLIPTPGGNQNMRVVTEPGFYAVVSRSDKPKAKAFQKWVRSEVLPSIRKYGCYPAPEPVEPRQPAASSSELAALTAAVNRLATAIEGDRAPRARQRVEPRQKLITDGNPGTKNPDPGNLCQTILEYKILGKTVGEILRDPHEFEASKDELEKVGVTLTSVAPGPRTYRSLDEMKIFLEPKMLKKNIFRSGNWTVSAITAGVVEIPGAQWQQRTINGVRHYGAVVDPAEFFKNWQDKLPAPEPILTVRFQQ